MQNFVALDFETANRNPSSVCSIGLVFVVDGQLADSYYRLIKPIPDYYSAFNTGIHGITAANTRRAPRFPDIWQELLPKIVIYRARYKMATSKRPAKTPSRAAAAIRLMKDLGYGEGYQLAHYHADKLTTMQTMPDNLIGRECYFPTEEDLEQRFKARLEQIKRRKAEH